MAHEVFHNPDFDISVWEELQRAIARHGGTELPWPTDEGFCDDCHSHGVRFARGTFLVCARDWARRDLASRRARARR